MNLSFASNFAFSLAAIETKLLYQQFIKPEMIVAGITKLEDIITEREAEAFGVPVSLLPWYRDEALQVLGLLEKVNIKPRDFRRKIRARIGEGNYRHRAEERISRDAEARTAFTRAEELAQAGTLPLVPVNLLFAALLELEQTAIHALLDEYGVDWHILYDSLLALDIRSYLEDVARVIEDAEKSTPSPSASSGGKLLASIGRDLIELALQGELHPAIGRDEEIRRVLVNLSRVRGANPLLIGDAGVGKTAIIEGMAYLIAHRHSSVPAMFFKKRILQIQAGALVRNTSLRGDFEARMVQLVEEASAEPDTILFIDEIHMLAGAGSGGNSNMDAFNLLKEPLARGKIRLIGATTESEYRRYIRIDDALDRRFTVINVRESTSDETMQILNLSRGKMESEYNVVISAESIEAAVELSVRYMPNRKLPDKAFELMHRACADVNFKAELEPEAGRTVTRLNIQEAFPEGIEPGNRDLHSFDVARMADVLKERVIGQPEAAEAVTQAVQRRYVGFNDNRPIGVFLFVGPTGVGKTEMVRAVAEFLFGSPEYITRIDMSEYMDRYSQSRLIGAPPGYVGYQEGGQLTGPLMTRPKSVVLLDEVEKAHPDILNTFLQVFDAGHITDSQGHQVNAREALFVMTSNLGVHQGMAPSEDMIMLSVKSHFKPEFINRLDAIIVFRPLQPQDLLQIARNQLGQLQKMLLMKNHIRLQVTESAVQYIAEKGYDAILGVRPLIRFIDKEIRTKIAQMIINDQIFDTDTLIIDFTGIELSFTRSLGETGN